MTANPVMKQKRRVDLVRNTAHLGFKMLNNIRIMRIVAMNQAKSQMLVEAATVIASTDSKSLCIILHYLCTICLFLTIDNICKKCS